jgi:hypothetical protein
MHPRRGRPISEWATSVGRSRPMCSATPVRPCDASTSRRRTHCREQLVAQHVRRRRSPRRAVAIRRRRGAAGPAPPPFVGRGRSFARMTHSVRSTESQARRSRASRASQCGAASSGRRSDARSDRAPTACCARCTAGLSCVFKTSCESLPFPRRQLRPPDVGRVGPSLTAPHGTRAARNAVVVVASPVAVRRACTRHPRARALGAGYIVSRQEIPRTQT